MISPAPSQEEVRIVTTNSTTSATAEKPPPKVLHASVDERIAHGRVARSEVPRRSHATLGSIERDPVELLVSQGEGRVPELLPIRYGRMLVSPFTFYRGAAALMAHDLAATPRSGLKVQLCGDAHLSNFGGFASPERTLVFDLNDFDETLPGPFEWDVKRLATSFEVAGRDRGFDEDTRRTIVLACAGAYRQSMQEFAAMRQLDVWYARAGEADVEQRLRSGGEKKVAKQLEKVTAKARAKDSMKAFAKLTELVDGEPRIVSDPPLIVPIAELAGHLDSEAVVNELRVLLRSYRRTLQADRRHLLEQFRFVDIARKVVGVGSVGTRCWIVLMLGRDGQDPLFLQVKEATASVLEPHLGKSTYANHGQRVVEGQRVMQAASDIFLGWQHTSAGLDGRARDFYVRQLWDWKASAAIDTMPAENMVRYGGLCAWTLARAHARSGDRIAIASYLGKSDSFDRALADFARAYADVNEADYAALKVAVEAGRVEAQEGL
jgi:uncharacterized protein (DUF2252 family)